MGSIVTERWQEEQFAIYSSSHLFLYIQYPNESRWFNVSLGNLFLGPTKYVSNLEICSTSTLTPQISSPLQRTTILFSTPSVSNTLNVVQVFYDMYYGWTFTANTSVIKLVYDPAGQQKYQIKSYKYAAERNVLYI